MIRNIPLQDAYNLLDKSAAIIVSSQPGNPIIYPELSKLTGELDNQFLSIYYIGDDAYEFVFSFKESNNQNPQIDTITNELILEDDEGEIRLLLLTPMVL